jgi:hypothetical protein
LRNTYKIKVTPIKNQSQITIIGIPATRGIISTGIGIPLWITGKS